MTIHPAYDWREAVRLALISRMMDELEENELVPQGRVTYQFSARGHELSQLLLAQQMTRPYDTASTYYRNRPFLLGCGLTPQEALASDMARTTSMSAGRDVGVVFHMLRRGRAMVLPAVADVGGQYTPGVGCAQAMVYRKDVLKDDLIGDSIVVIFGGDGSVASNGFWAALNVSTTLRLPVLFVIEDNDYAISVVGPRQTPGGNIAMNLAAFKNLHIWDGSGSDPAQTAALVSEAVETVRRWEGPGLLRLSVPRLSGHSSVDNQTYKPPARVADEQRRDPIPALKGYLVPTLLSELEWEEMHDEAAATLRLACDTAERDSRPDPATVTLGVFSDPAHPQRVGGLVGEGVTLPAGTDVPQPPSPSRMNMVEAIRRTLDVELGVNPRCLVFGEDVGYKGGVHAATVGLQANYGEGRVFDTNLSEEGIIGRSVGMAYFGLVPVPEIQFRKYADPATEQINNLGTIRWRSNNDFAAPVVIRVPGGFRKIGDPWHSVTSEVTFTHQPGLMFAVPSNAEDAVGLLRTALRGNDPVIFFEHRYLLDAAWARRPYPGDSYMLPFGKAARVREGRDLTVVTWGAMVERCEQAADALGASVDILDLRTLVPWDKDAVLESVRKTGKALVVHEDILFGGFGAEVAAVIASEGFAYLDGPVERFGAPSAPVPFSTDLMEGVIPRAEGIKAKMTDLLAY